MRMLGAVDRRFSRLQRMAAYGGQQQQPQQRTGWFGGGAQRRDGW